MSIWALDIVEGPTASFEDDDAPVAAGIVSVHSTCSVFLRPFSGRFVRVWDLTEVSTRDPDGNPSTGFCHRPVVGGFPESQPPASQKSGEVGYHLGHLDYGIYAPMQEALLKSSTREKTVRALPFLA